MNLYEQYRKSKFDLSAFGIERGPSRSDYFCTPKGAKIIGWTGVGGIHYCTLTAFGDTVFAVDPSGDAGRHAFPVAESFDDLLRLLMACGHEAHVEQAHSWSRDQFGRFVKENPAHYVKMTYTLEPELSGNRFTVSDTRQSDAPKKSASSGRTYDFESSIVLTVPVSDKNETASAIRSACSALTFEPQEKVEWKMIFREKTVQDMQFTLL